jgi:hypothetical protein
MLEENGVLHIGQQDAPLLSMPKYDHQESPSPEVVKGTSAPTLHVRESASRALLLGSVAMLVHLTSSLMAREQESNQTFAAYKVLQSTAWSGTVRPREERKDH